MPADEKILVQVDLEDGGFRRGIGDMISSIDKMKVKNKEATFDIGLATVALVGLAGAAIGAGKGLVDMLAGFLTDSPQFKAFLAELEVPFFQLSDFLGSTFQSSLDAGVKLVQQFVDLLTSDVSKNVFKTINDAITLALDNEIKLNDEFIKLSSTLAGIASSDIMDFLFGKTEYKTTYGEDMATVVPVHQPGLIEGLQQAAQYGNGFINPIGTLGTGIATGLQASPDLLKTPFERAGEYFATKAAEILRIKMR